MKNALPDVAAYALVAPFVMGIFGKVFHQPRGESAAGRVVRIEQYSSRRRRWQHCRKGAAYRFVEIGHLLALAGAVGSPLNEQ